MMRKFVWLMVSILMVLSLLIMSCSTTEDTGGIVTTEDKGQTVTVGGGEEEKEETSVQVQEGPEMVELTLTKLDGTKVTKKLEEPQYGGTIMTTIMLPPKQFDPFLFHQFFSPF